MMGELAQTRVASDEQLLEIVRNLVDVFRAHDWHRRIHASIGPDIEHSFSFHRSFDELDKALSALEVTLVFTSHPSEVRPPSVVRALASLSADSSEQDYLEELRALDSKVSLERPSVADEVEALVGHFERVIIDALLAHVQRADTAAAALFGSDATAIPCVFRLHTWVGADRDGNPSITAEATYAAGLRYRKAAIETYKKLLHAMLEMTTVPAFQNEIAAFLEKLDDSLLTPEQLTAAAARIYICAGSEALEQPLRMFQVAMQNFGLHLATLEWRENSAVIMQAYEETQQAEKLDDTSLSSDSHGLIASLRSLARLREENGARSVGVMIISNCEDVTVILALEHLARQCGVFELGEIAVVPLLESIDALRAAPRILTEMLDNAHMLERVRNMNNTLEVMLGYSDAAKDGGRLMADHATRTAQRNVAEVCARYGVTPHVFHGRGGTPARGYAKIHESFSDLDAKMPRGVVKQTEQGEIIANRYGNKRLAADTFDSWLVEALTHSRLGDTGVDAGPVMEHLAADAYTSYRSLRDDKHFLKNFMSVTPLADVCRMPLSSRPAARVSDDDGASSITLQRLRAIPLNFAANAIRMQVPAWFGTGFALEQEIERHGYHDLRYLYQNSPQFRMSLDRAAWALSLSDLSFIHERAHDVATPAIHAFLLTIENEAVSLHTALRKLGVEIPQIKHLEDEESVLRQVQHTLLERPQHGHLELASTALAAAAAAIGMSG